MNEEVLKKLLPDLRALRLWHWKLLAHHYHHPVGDNALENFHMKQVQLLNSFFPVGDTAEQDFNQIAAKDKVQLNKDFGRVS